MAKLRTEHMFEISEDLADLSDHNTLFWTNYQLLATHYSLLTTDYKLLNTNY